MPPWPGEDEAEPHPGNGRPQSDLSGAALGQVGGSSAQSGAARQRAHPVANAELVFTGPLDRPAVRVSTGSAHFRQHDGECESSSVMQGSKSPHSARETGWQGTASPRLPRTGV
jgi:hypothetical protein